MPEKNAIGATIKVPEVKVHCGDCIYFSRTHTFDKPCSKLGILAKNQPCTRFTVDVFQLSQSSGKEEKTILTKFKTGSQNISPLELLGGLSKPDLMRFAALALGEYRSRSRGYSAGQQVYVQVFGSSSDPYINCFFKAWVLQTTRTHILVRGENPEFRGYYSIDGDNVLTSAKWKKLKKKLTASGKINSPRFTQAKVKDPDDHKEPPIDESYKEAPNGPIILRGKSL